MKKKKNLFAIIAVLLILVVGATIAYFQSSASFENVFNTGIYKVTTTETFESPSNWAPGEEIPKTITTKNEGTIDAAVRVSFTEKWEDSEGNDITSQVPNGTVIINLDNTSDWTQEGNYYYYNYILNPTETTSSFIKSVTLSDSINGMNCTPSADGLTQTCESNSIIQGATYKLTITKETVQADKYKDIWNTNVDIIQKTPYLYFASEKCVFNDLYIGVKEGVNNIYVRSDHKLQLSDGFTSRPANFSVYLKYTLDNGKLVSGILPDVCIFDNDYGELCLEKNKSNSDSLEYLEKNTEKIKSYFNFDENTWSLGSHNEWFSPEGSITCIFNIDNSSCDDFDSGVHAYANYLGEIKTCSGDYDKCAEDKREYAIYFEKVPDNGR